MSIITRKIELWINEEDVDKRKEVWSYLRSLNNDIYRVANLIVNNQYFNDFYENRVVLSDETIIDLDSEIRRCYGRIKRTKDVAEKAELENELERLKEQKQTNLLSAREFYGTSKQNTTYRISSRSFPHIPSSILACLNSQIVSVLKTERKEVVTGARAVRSYKKGMPIPFQFDKDSKPYFISDEDEIYLNWFNEIQFVLRFGRDKSGNRLIVDRVLNGEYGLSDSSIKIDDRKIFLLLVVKLPDEIKELNTSLSVGVDLGINIPAFCALSEGYARLAIGNKDDFLRVRLQMQRRRRELQRSLTLTAGGRGRGKKLKAIERLKDQERHFVRTYNHTLTKRIVEFAEKYRAGTIKVELLDGYGRDEKGKLLKGDFILRNWSYYELQSMLEDKAKRKGITIVFVDPYHTSQTCAVCGHYEEGQRETQQTFVCKNQQCKNFNERANADYNAALNISRSTKIVTSKEECEYYKNHT